MCYSGDENSRQFLVHITRRLIADTGLTPVVGAEIEFYLEGQLSGEQVFADIAKACSEANIAIGPVEKERGLQQYEYQLQHMPDPLAIAEQLVVLRQIIGRIARQHGLTALFDAKPFPSEPGSALHIHINLLDSQGKNLFQKQDNHESDMMQYALGGLCWMLKESMIIFSPTAESYGRFVPHMEAPTTICWGGNNRTTALRIPDSDRQNRRIEHRVPSADCDPFLAIGAVFAGMHYGIVNKIPAPERIYGNAFEPNYGLELLPRTLEEAKDAFLCSAMMKEYGGIMKLMPQA